MRYNTSPPQGCFVFSLEIGHPRDKVPSALLHPRLGGAAWLPGCYPRLGGGLTNSPLGAFLIIKDSGNSTQVFLQDSWNSTQVFFCVHGRNRTLDGTEPGFWQKKSHVPKKSRFSTVQVKNDLRVKKVIFLGLSDFGWKKIVKIGIVPTLNLWVYNSGVLGFGGLTWSKIYFGPLSRPRVNSGSHPIQWFRLKKHVWAR